MQSSCRYHYSTLCLVRDTDGSMPARDENSPAAHLKSVNINTPSTSIVVN